MTTLIHLKKCLEKDETKLLKLCRSRDNACKDVSCKDNLQPLIMMGNKKQDASFKDKVGLF